MLARVLEPEVMDSPAEAHDYDSMDHAAVNRAFADDFVSLVSGSGSVPHSTEGLEKGTVLDLGTGTALIPIEICRRAPELCVTAVDAAPSMLDVARANVVSAGLFDRIALEQVDAKKLPYADGQFEATISNSIVHHIPEPRAVLGEGVRVTARGGWLFWRDLLRPDTHDLLQTIVQQYAGGATPRQRALFAESLRAALTLEEIRALVAEWGFAGDTVNQTSDRHWTFAAQRPTA
jgi:ubiquinone/menaquinone biosynthesis C-methylase UbiE